LREGASLKSRSCDKGLTVDPCADGGTCPAPRRSPEPKLFRPMDLGPPSPFVHHRSRMTLGPVRAKCGLRNREDGWRPARPSRERRRRAATDDGVDGCRLDGAFGRAALLTSSHCDDCCFSHISHLARRATRCVRPVPRPGGPRRSGSTYRCSGAWTRPQDVNEHLRGKAVRLLFCLTRPQEVCGLFPSDAKGSASTEWGPPPEHRS
jgi:hypothetical protein